MQVRFTAIVHSFRTTLLHFTITIELTPTLASTVQVKLGTLTLTPTPTTTPTLTLTLTPTLTLNLTLTLTLAPTLQVMRAAGGRYDFSENTSSRLSSTDTTTDSDPVPSRPLYYSILCYEILYVL